MENWLRNGLWERNAWGLRSGAHPVPRREMAKSSIHEEIQETMARDDATKSELRLTPVLFDLPEYDWAFAKFVQDTLNELIIRVAHAISWTVNSP